MEEPVQTGGYVTPRTRKAKRPPESAERTTVGGSGLKRVGEGAAQAAVGAGDKGGTPTRPNGLLIGPPRFSCSDQGSATPSREGCVEQRYEVAVRRSRE